MTLYHYVWTKDELLSLVVDSVMGEVAFPDNSTLPKGWREAITLIAGRSRDALLRHPWMLDIAEDTAFGPNGVRHFDQTLEALSSLSADLPLKLDIAMLVDEYVFGYCLHSRSFDVPEEPGRARRAHRLRRDLVDHGLVSPALGPGRNARHADGVGPDPNPGRRQGPLRTQPQPVARRCRTRPRIELNVAGSCPRRRVVPGRRHRGLRAEVVLLRRRMPRCARRYTGSASTSTAPRWISKAVTWIRDPSRDRWPMPRPGERCAVGPRPWATRSGARRTPTRRSPCPTHRGRSPDRRPANTAR